MSMESLLFALGSGAIASIIAVFIVEAVWLPLVRRMQLRRATGTYHIHDILGNALGNNAGDINYAKLKIKGWFKPMVFIEAFDYDTHQAWTAVANFDALGYHGYGFYRYNNQVDAGTIDLVSLNDNDSRWACRTYAYHVSGYAIFHWHKQ